LQKHRKEKIDNKTYEKNFSKRDKFGGKNLIKIPKNKNVEEKFWKEKVADQKLWKKNRNKIYIQNKINSSMGRGRWREETEDGMGKEKLKR
jgi:hypothetical protein